MAYLELLGVWVDGPRDEAVPANTATPIDLPRGSAVIVAFTLVDSLGHPVDLDTVGADRLVLSARQPIGDSVLFDIVGTKLGEIGRYQFVFTSNLTIDYSGQLIYDVWATRGGAQQQVMFPAYLSLTPRMRNP